MYGVVNISYHEAEKLIAHLEFEPGLYTNHQMKAIRSEYLKLKGVMFAWVEGIYPSDNTRIALKFESHRNLLNYTHWSDLNTLYFSQVRSINHNINEAIVEIPEGRYTDVQLSNIRKKYGNLPGVLSVQPRVALTTVENAVSLETRRENLLSLSNTWWVKVGGSAEKEKADSNILSNEMSIKPIPLYHKYRNKTENSFWENRCDLH